MRAAVRTRYGSAETVRVVDLPRPEPAAGELLVRVHATTVNRTDCGFRAGTPFVVRFFAGIPHPRVAVLGCEFAGVVVATGGDVAAFAVGDAVFGYVEGRFGGHAEYLTVPADAGVAPVPAGVTLEQAAAATEGSHYALGIIRSVGVEAGQPVLVHGATGAIGSAAVQLLAGAGARVTAVCDTAHVELVRTLGAERVVDRYREDFTRLEERFDLVLDAVGRSSFGRCRRLLTPRGTYVSTELGPRGENPLLALLTPHLGGRRVRFPIPSDDPEQVRHLGALLADGSFTPVIDRRYDLDRIVDAYRYVESGRKIGNVVVHVVPGAAARR